MNIEWLVPIARARSITMALHSLAADARGARGCVGCSVSTDIGRHGTIRYVEEWETEGDLRRRLQSDAFAQLAVLIESAEQPPRIQFTLDGRTRGLDFVEEVRQA